MKRPFAFMVSLALFLALSGPVFSQDALILTLDDCIRMALRQNPFYLAEKAKEEAASATVREAVAGFFPSVNAQGSNILDKKVFSIVIPPFYPGMPSQKVKMDFTRAYQMSLNFSLPLFTGGQLLSGFKQANLNLEATQEGIRQLQQETVLNVKKGFYGILLARKFVEVSEEALALAEKHRTNVQNLYDVGMASKFDLLRSEVQAANLKPQLIRARNSLATAELGLKTLLAIDPALSVQFRGELTFQAVEVNVDENIARALADRPEITQLRLQKQMAAEMVKMARAAYLPTLAVGGAYNVWGDQFNFKRNTWENYYQVNLVMSVPIFNGFVNGARLGQSKAALKQVELGEKGLADAVRFEVQQSILAIQQARESLLSQEKNVEQAQEAVRIADLNYSEGLATTLDVSGVQMALSQARTNYTQALFDYAVALAQLERAVGRNQDRYEAK